MAVGYLYDPVLLEHDTGQHPERPERLTAVLEQLRACKLLSVLTLLEAPPATEADLLRVHDAGLISRVLRLTESGGGQLEADTPVSAGSLRAAQCAAGASIEAVRAVLNGRVAQAYALVRPPGHHATRRAAMGFCLFCNVAVAAAWALAVGGLRRLAIVDFDVHHGNGTVDAFADNDRVLYLSTHEHPLYPFSGAPEYTGRGRSTGLCVNIALPPG
ncbi:MAG: histone deacetylase, partial [Chloroflexi bacterium]|nr:histone deacetylase [Chloroflexota bacterium]